MSLCIIVIQCFWTSISLNGFGNNRSPFESTAFCYTAGERLQRDVIRNTDAILQLQFLYRKNIGLAYVTHICTRNF